MDKPSFPLIPACWSCGKSSKAYHFCPACGKIQPVGTEGKDYFQFLGCSQAMCLSGEELRKRFYSLSRKFHPDYYQNSTQQELDFSLERSATLNRAYHTLRDPLARAKHLLEQAGFANDEAKTQPPADLLMEVMELQEGIEELKGIQEPKARTQAEGNLGWMQQELQEREKEILDQIEALFEVWDRNPDERASLALKLQELINTRNYLARTLKTLDGALNQPDV